MLCLSNVTGMQAAMEVNKRYVDVSYNKVPLLLRMDTRRGSFRERAPWTYFSYGEWEDDRDLALQYTVVGRKKV